MCGNLNLNRVRFVHATIQRNHAIYRVCMLVDGCRLHIALSAVRRGRADEFNLAVPGAGRPDGARVGVVGGCVESLLTQNYFGANLCAYPSANLPAGLGGSEMMPAPRRRRRPLLLARSPALRRNHSARLRRLVAKKFPARREKDNQVSGQTCRLGRAGFSLRFSEWRPSSMHARCFRPLLTVGMRLGGCGWVLRRGVSVSTGAAWRARPRPRVGLYC